jgi:hypothetical protein
MLHIKLESIVHNTSIRICFCFLSQHRISISSIRTVWYELRNLHVYLIYISQRWHNVLWSEFEPSWTKICLTYHRQTQLKVDLGCGNREHWPPSAWAKNQATIYACATQKGSNDFSWWEQNYLQPTNHASPNCRRRSDDCHWCEEVWLWQHCTPKVMQILCMLAHANLPFYASVCCLPSSLIPFLLNLGLH